MPGSASDLHWTMHFIALQPLVSTLCFGMENAFEQSFITRRRSWRFAEYWKHFVARLNDVHAFGYNSARRERIWMKFGEVRVYRLELAVKITCLWDYTRNLWNSRAGSMLRSAETFTFLLDARVFAFKLHLWQYMRKPIVHRSSVQCLFRFQKGPEHWRPHWH